LFWTELLERAAKETDLYDNVGPREGGWVATGAGKSGLRYECTVTQHSATAELYIDRRKESGTQNGDIFDQLIASKEAIDGSIGESLEWQQLEGNRACRVRKQIDIGEYRDEDKWPEIHQAMIQAVIRLEEAFRPYIDKLEIPVVAASEKNFETNLE
jgi:hypothetical protein